MHDRQTHYCIESENVSPCACVSGAICLPTHATIKQETDVDRTPLSVQMFIPAEMFTVDRLTWGVYTSVIIGDVNYFVMWQSGCVVYVFSWSDIFCPPSSGGCYIGGSHTLKALSSVYALRAKRTYSEGKKRSHMDHGRKNTQCFSLPDYCCFLIQVPTSPKRFSIVTAITGCHYQHSCG
jgi:hypothetical protein